MTSLTALKCPHCQVALHPLTQHDVWGCTQCGFGVKGIEVSHVGNYQAVWQLHEGIIGEKGLLQKLGYEL